MVDRVTTLAPESKSNATVRRNPSQFRPRVSRPPTALATTSQQQRVVSRLQHIRKPTHAASRHDGWSARRQQASLGHTLRMRRNGPARDTMVMFLSRVGHMRGAPLTRSADGGCDAGGARRRRAPTRTPARDIPPTPRLKFLSRRRLGGVDSKESSAPRVSEDRCEAHSGCPQSDVGP